MSLGLPLAVLGSGPDGLRKEQHHQRLCHFLGHSNTAWTPLHDVRIVCSDGDLCCHRLVLAAASPRFLRPLLRPQEDDVSTLLMPLVSKKDMENVLALIYNGETNITQASGSNLLEHLSLLEIPVENLALSSVRPVEPDSSAIQGHSEAFHNISGHSETFPDIPDHSLTNIPCDQSENVRPSALTPEKSFSCLSAQADETERDRTSLGLDSENAGKERRSADDGETNFEDPATSHPTTETSLKRSFDETYVSPFPSDEESPPKSTKMLSTTPPRILQRRPEEASRRIGTVRLSVQNASILASQLAAAAAAAHHEPGPSFSMRATVDRDNVVQLSIPDDPVALPSDKDLLAECVKKTVESEEFGFPLPPPISPSTDFDTCSSDSSFEKLDFDFSSSDLMDFDPDDDDSLLSHVIRVRDPFAGLDKGVVNPALITVKSKVTPQSSNQPNDLNSDILYKCDLCGERFLLMDFLQHQSVHANDYPYACEHPSCSKKFKTQSEFRAHRRISHKSHKGTSRGFVCPHCKKVFKFLGSLKSHLVSHISSSPYPCKFCSQRFPNMPALEAHNVEHQLPSSVSGGIFTCKICNTAHISWEEFSKHFLRTHGSVPRILLKYKCVPCNRSFSSKSDYLKHNMTLHNLPDGIGKR